MLKIFREEEVLVQNGNVIDAKNFYLYDLFSLNLSKRNEIVANRSIENRGKNRSRSIETIERSRCVLRNAACWQLIVQQTARYEFVCGVS